MLKFIILGTLFIHSFSLINEDTLDRFNQWINKYQIESTDYSLSIILDNWIFNDKYINEINNKNLSYKLDHNIFSGFSLSDFDEINFIFTM